ncbi:MAG TPA: serine/threonine-protein kinase, partial [Gemmatirosa sp.]|nr:serine/threonine-protein kinase [Gemmatirosa sp.]
MPSDDRAWQASERGDEPAYDSSPVPELAEQFEVLGELGRGGSAVVYLARDLRLLRTVALKVVRLPPALPPRERRERVARLAREARTVARLEHPNIVGVYAVHELPDGLAVAMPHVRGMTLKQHLATEGALPPERAVRLVHDLAQALAHAHAEGVVHRDVKPENIFVDATTGRALLSDFGAARAGDADVRVTHTGTTVGTPAYMSPEQIDGGAIDGRADIYSLGLVAWEMLTGHRPWAGSGLYQLLHQQKHEELPPIESVRPTEAGPVPLTLQYVVERMLEKRPAARWASATAVAEQVVHPVLPPDFAHWKRALRRRLARPSTTGAAAAAGAATATALTEQLRPGAGTGERPADAAVEPASAADSPTATLADDAPSWARPARSRRGWLFGAAALAVVAAGVPLALRLSGPDARPSAPPTMQVAAESRGSVEVPL